MLKVITHPCLIVNGGLIKPPLNEVRAWMSNYNPRFYMDVIIYPCPYHNADLAKKERPDRRVFI